MIGVNIGMAEREKETRAVWASEEKTIPDKLHIPDKLRILSSQAAYDAASVMHLYNALAYFNYIYIL